MKVNELIEKIEAARKKREAETTTARETIEILEGKKLYINEEFKKIIYKEEFNQLFNIDMEELKEKDKEFNFNNITNIKYSNYEEDPTAAGKFLRLEYIVFETNDIISYRFFSLEYDVKKDVYLLPVDNFIPGFLPKYDF